MAGDRPVNPSDESFLAELRQTVLQRIESGEMTLPVLPVVVVRAMDELRKADYELATVVRILEPDPVVAARILRLANSAALTTRQRMTSLAPAVTHLGGTRLRSFLLEIGAQRIFASTDPGINRACRLLWQHSVAVGLLARDLATGGGAPSDQGETAYLTGLLHDIGKPVLAGLLLEAERQQRGQRRPGWITADRWILWVADLHRRVGVTLARRWDMPADIEHAIANAVTLDEQNPMGLTNVLVLANALTKREGLYAGPVDGAQIEMQIAGARDLLGVTADALVPLCAHLSDRVAARFL